LRKSALVIFGVLLQCIYFQNTSGTDLQNTGFLPGSARLAVKYRPGRWNTGHLATLDIRLRRPSVDNRHTAELITMQGGRRASHRFPAIKNFLKSGECENSAKVW